jgi:hypothetical protein
MGKPALIANPLYDSVFKYLMEDQKIARLLLGAIIGETITALEPRPQEFSLPADAPGAHTVYRLDFSAVIKTPHGSRTVIVEVQKAKLATDIIRFRRYLGQQYANPENSEERGATKIGLPIISIYFLGYPLEGLEAPIIKVQRAYLDVSTQTVCPGRHEFLESLTHDSYVIQVTRLKRRRRTDLEAVLAVFDPENRTADHHILNVREDEIPSRFRPLLRRLQAAAATAQVRETMIVEDEIFAELADVERRCARALEALHERSGAERERPRAEKDQALSEKERALALAVRVLLAEGKTIAEISGATGLVTDEVQRLADGQPAADRQPETRLREEDAPYRTPRPAKALHRGWLTEPPTTATVGPKKRGPVSPHERPTPILRRGRRRHAELHGLGYKCMCPLFVLW